MSDEQQLAIKLLAGWPAPAEMYEVRDLECVKLDDRVQATVTVVNNNDFAWAFGVEVVYFASAGKSRANRTDQGFWQPGQSVVISDWAGRPELYDDPPRCEVNIYHGADLAYQDPDRRAEIHERLGWDPVNEQRLDGS